MSVPAHGSVRLQFDVYLQEPGKFSQVIPIYVEDGGLRTMELTVRGVAQSTAKPE